MEQELRGEISWSLLHSSHHTLDITLTKILVVWENIMRQHQNSAILMLSKAYFYGYCQSADIVLAVIFIQLSQLEQFCSRKFTEKCIFPLFRRSFSCVMNYPVMIYRIWWDTFGELTKDNQSAAQRSPCMNGQQNSFKFFMQKA